VQIGIDASGKFETGEGYRPTVLAAAIGPDRAFTRIGEWTEEALRRWGRDGELAELHANELRDAERLEVCRMLAATEDIRLAAVATDSLLLGSAGALAAHRERQYAKSASTPALTEAGRRRKQEILRQLEGRRLRDADYAFGVVLARIGMAALSRVFGYFGAERWRDDLRAIEIFVDQEAPPTRRYAQDTLLVTVSGDERFRVITPEHWRRPPVHPFLQEVLHDDGDGLQAEALLGDMSWVASEERVAVQVADMAAWVVGRSLARPEDLVAREMLEALTPLLLGADGWVCEFFSPIEVGCDLEALYTHLRRGDQPGWWLVPRG
jgi:hypothetical protein